MIKYIFISILFLVLGSTDGYSQYYGNAAGGVDRSIGSGIRENKPSKKKAEKDYATDYVQYLDKELKLDDLQKVAITSMINDSKDSLIEISKLDVPAQEKKDKVQEISDKISAKILKLLSSEQSEKFLKIKEENNKRALTN